MAKKKAFIDKEDDDIDEVDEDSEDEDEEEEKKPIKKGKKEKERVLVVKEFPTQSVRKVVGDDGKEYTLKREEEALTEMYKWIKEIREELVEK